MESGLRTRIGVGMGVGPSVVLVFVRRTRYHMEKVRMRALSQMVLSAGLKWKTYVVRYYLIDPNPWQGEHSWVQFTTTGSGPLSFQTKTLHGQ